LACAVTVNAQVPLPDGQHLLMSESGAPLDPPLTSNVERRDEDSYVAPVKPVLNSLTPNTAVSGDPDIEMLIDGTGFTPNSVIVFNGYDEPTDFHSETSIGTGVRPSIFGPGALPVYVRDANGNSNSLDFTFTAPIGARGRKLEPDDPDTTETRRK
jgi:hypothetical protein